MAKGTKPGGHGPRGAAPSEERPASWVIPATILANLLGVSVAVLLAARGPLPQLPRPIVVLLAILCGWCVTMLLLPWTHIGVSRRVRSDIQRLASALEHIEPDAGNRALGHFSSTDRSVAELAGVVRDILRRARANLWKSRAIERTLDDAVKRKTHLATHKLRQEVMTDPLTGLGNRRLLDETLENLFGPDRRRQRDVVVAMVIDIDRFKVVNDTLGHEVGDRCLEFLGELLSSAIRREDTAIRSGGDEFIVLVPDQTLTESEGLAERLQRLFAQMPWGHAEVPPPRLSIGIGSIECHDPGGARELLRRADDAVYAAKDAGGNTVRVCQTARTTPWPQPGRPWGESALPRPDAPHHRASG